MSAGLLVDRFLGSEERLEFQTRQESTDQTLEVLGLDTGNVLLTGASALAKHAVNAHLRPDASDTWTSLGYDVDALISADEAARIAASLGAKAEDYIDKGRFKLPAGCAGNTLRFSGAIIPDWNREGHIYDIVHGEGGTLTLPIGSVALGKVDRGAMKDFGLLKAQVIAHAEGHPITHDLSWRIAIGVLVDRAKGGSIRSPLGSPRGLQSFPRWLMQLRKREFDHPAFDGLTSLISLEAA